MLPSLPVPPIRYDPHVPLSDALTLIGRIPGSLQRDGLVATARKVARRLLALPSQTRATTPRTHDDLASLLGLTPDDDYRC
jgi:hypothetical protein